MCFIPDVMVSYFIPLTISKRLIFLSKIGKYLSFTEIINWFTYMTSFIFFRKVSIFRKIKIDLKFIDIFLPYFFSFYTLIDKIFLLIENKKNTLYQIDIYSIRIFIFWYINQIFILVQPSPFPFSCSIRFKYLETYMSSLLNCYISTKFVHLQGGQKKVYDVM